MIICPNCRNSELPGALFCSQCGALLEGVDGIATQSLKPSTGILSGDQSEEGGAMPPMAAELQASVSLCVVDSGNILPLENRTEFTIGRSAEGQPIMPDIDLSPHQAYEMGVSRLHASIRLDGQQVMATDLGSVNGTRLNGQKIPPHKPCTLNHGDILTLGKLKLQVLLRHESSS